jgi:predicted RNA-binding protein
MCEANAYLIEGDQSKMIMEAVETVEPEGDGIRLVNIFGEQKYVEAQIYSISLTDNKVFLKQSK